MSIFGSKSDLTNDSRHHPPTNSEFVPDFVPILDVSIEKGYGWLLVAVLSSVMPAYISVTAAVAAPLAEDGIYTYRERGAGTVEFSPLVDPAPLVSGSSW
jgi:hypothetical protein